MDEATLRTRAEALRAEQRRLGEQALQLEDMLEGPRVVPVLCFWRYHSYCEEEAFSDTVDEAFGELEGMEEYGTASTVGVRIGGYLITHADRGDARFWQDDAEVRADSDKRHRELLAAGDD